MWTGRQTLYGISLMTLLCMAFYGYGKLSFQKSIVQGSAEIIKLFASSYNCTQEMAKLNAETVEQDDPRLITAIKRCYLEPPSRLPYNLANPNRPDYSQAGQANYVDNLHKHAVSVCSFIYLFLILHMNQFISEVISNTHILQNEN